MITKFKPKCVYGIWRDDVLEDGCKGYMADSAVDLKNKFCNGGMQGIMKAANDDDEKAFPFCEMQSEIPHMLCYYDPYEPFTRAYDNGATIMFEGREVTEHELEYEELDAKDLYVKSEVSRKSAEIRVGSVWRNRAEPGLVSMITQRTSDGMYLFSHNPTKFTADEIKAHWRELSHE